MFKKSSKLAFICLIIVGIALVLGGCFSLNPAKGTGKLKVAISIPEEFLPKFISHTITLASVNVSITNGVDTSTQTITITGNSVEAVFSNLQTGNWDVNVTALDTENYTVYSGQSTANVTANAVAPCNINLYRTKGSLNVTVNIPAGLQAATGTITLLNVVNPAANQVQNLTIAGTTATATFTDINSTTWPVVIRLVDASGAEITTAKGQVDVLPGRTSSALITINAVTGEINVSISWELPPAVPTGLTATVGTNSIVLDWAANTEQDLVGYLVYRANSAAGEKVLLTDVILTASAYTDTDAALTQGTTYYYWVQAFDTMGYASNLSAPASVLYAAPAVYNLIFTSTRSNVADIYAVKSDGTGLTNLTNRTYMDAMPSFSPNGDKIVFVGTTSFTDQIFVMNTDGTGLTQLTFDGDDQLKRKPHFSHNGTKIVFEHYVNGNYELFIMNALDGSGKFRLTNNTASDIDTTLQPFGSQIVWKSTQSGTDELWIMNDDGTNARNLIAGTMLESDPHWSPDGSKILYTGYTNAQSDIWVCNADGTNPTQLTTSVSADRDAKWSPDGTKIVFYSNRDGNSEIYVMDANGMNQTRVTNNTTRDETPVWSPDGKKIAFIAYGASGTGEAFVMNANGTEIVNVSNDPNEDQEVLFSPVL